MGHNFPTTATMADESQCLPVYASPSFWREHHELAAKLVPFSLGRIHENPRTVVTSETPPFGPRIDVYFEGATKRKNFHCVICNRLSELVYQNGTVISTCRHFVPCNECRSYTVRHLLRCTGCCNRMVGGFPVCENGHCMSMCNLLSTNLKTAQCVFCEDKLVKETCGTTCNRMEREWYKNYRQVLRERVFSMVVDPQLCEDRVLASERPCSHFTVCDEHHHITRGRARRCPACRRPRG